MNRSGAGPEGALRLLTIAGSDSGGGAGIQADLKTFSAHGAFGMSAITAVTAQNTRGVRGVIALPADFVRAQIEAVLDDIGADAIKVGMLANAAIVETVSASLVRYGSIPAVIDPVMVASSGDSLLDDDAVSAIRELLLPRATVATPNLPEAERLGERRTRSSADREELARALGAYSPAVLLKGGHAGEDPVTDLLWDGRELHRFAHPRISTRACHGTGCSLAAAIAARLGRGEMLVDAVAGAIDWLHQAIAHAVPLGDGDWPVDALWKQRPFEASFA